MGRLAQFEYPLPIIKTDAEEIKIETSGGNEGNFEIWNAGGSELEGTITSNSKSIVFMPETFKGNRTVITYMINLDIYKPGDTIRTSALIMSNGGEKIIPFEIKVVPSAIITKDGRTISSLRQYLKYVQENSVGSRQLFTQKDFMMWLFNTGYEHMDLYEQFATDPNKERAVDNFLILNRLKEKSCVSIVDKDVKVSLMPNGDSAIAGGIKFSRTTWGYAEVFLNVRRGGSWFKLSKSKITGADFNSDNIAEVDYIVMPEMLKNKHNSAIIEIETDGEIVERSYIQANMQPMIDAVLGKESYELSDNGKIVVTNNTGTDLMVEVSTKDNFVRFESGKYYISGFAEIKFDTKPTSFQLAQFALKKQLVIKSEIYVRVVHGDHVFRKTFKIQMSGIKN